MRQDLRAITLCVLFALVVYMTGCKNPRKIPDNFDYGHWTGTTYRNDFFGFELTVPADWHISGDANAELREAMNTANELGFTNEKEAAKILKAAEVTTANLFMVARYTDEEATEKEAFNPNILSLAENISLPGKAVSQADYVQAFRQNATKTVPGLVILSEETKKIGNRDFTSLRASFGIQGVVIQQEHLIRLEKGFALVFALTWVDDQEKTKLDDIMATLSWL